MLLCILILKHLNWWYERRAVTPFSPKTTVSQSLQNLISRSYLYHRNVFIQFIRCMKLAFQNAGFICTLRYKRIDWAKSLWDASCSCINVFFSHHAIKNQPLEKYVIGRKNCMTSSYSVVIGFGIVTSRTQIMLLKAAINSHTLLFSYANNGGLQHLLSVIFKFWFAFKLLVTLPVEYAVYICRMCLCMASSFYARHLLWTSLTHHRHNTRCKGRNVRTQQTWEKTWKMRDWDDLCINHSSHQSPAARVLPLRHCKYTLSLDKSKTSSSHCRPMQDLVSHSL